MTFKTTPSCLLALFGFQPVSCMAGGQRLKTWLTEPARRFYMSADDAICRLASWEIPPAVMA
jgi:hypothetical protein